MAWRDARSNKKRLLVYISAIIIGVAAQVAITSFRDSLNYTIDRQSKELLGADLRIDSEDPFTGEQQAFFDSLGGATSTMVDFPSMALFPGSGTRLSDIRAVEGGFPFYGELETDPAGAARAYRDGKRALVDNVLMDQFGLQPGDSVKVGDVTFEIAGSLLKIPGQNLAISMVNPRIFIPRAWLDSTNLVQRGSRIDYNIYFRFDEGRDLQQVEDTARAFAEAQEPEYDLDIDTVEERQEELGEVVGNLGRFLNLVGFIALLLGGIGVASSIHVYIQRKINTASVLSCFGASGRQVTGIFLIQALVLGLLGALAGVLAGVGLQYLLPGLFSTFLPVEVILRISWLAIGLGLLTGTGVALVFALLPLLSLRKASPLYALRSLKGSLTALLSWRTRYGVYAAVALTVTAYAALLTGSLLAGIYFTAGILAALGLLWGVAQALIWAVRRWFPAGWPYVWRQGLANLYRPNNQTTVLMLSLGLGMLMVSTLYFSQDMLMAELEFASREDAPDLVLFDIQSDQNEGVNRIIRSGGGEIIQNVPMVTMRISHLRGRPADSVEADTAGRVSGWALNREYRATYRDSLTDSETLVEGAFTGSVPDTLVAVPVSASREIARDLGLELGDSLTFDVQGVPVQAYVGSLREVDFQRVSPNFFMVFPEGVLEGAPQIWVTISRVGDRQAAASIQQQVVRAFPNVSAIDITRVLETINEFIDQISFAIRFMALFSILTGLIVLASSVATSRYQRIRESTLLRTLGASRAQIIKILSVEYLFLGVLSALTGLILSVGATWLLAGWYFGLNFAPDPWVIVIGTAAVTALTIAIGMLNSRSVYRKTPLEVLRQEHG